MRKRKRNKELKYILLCTAVILIELIAAMIIKKGKAPLSKNGFELVAVDNDHEGFTNVYQQEYQDAIHEQVESLKSNYRYNLENPLLISNPYQTVTNGVYIYFSTKEEQEVTYTISCEGYEDYTATAYGDDTDALSKEHEFMMIGFIPGKTNTVQIQTKNAKGKQQSVSFTYDCPEALGDYNIPQLEVEQGESKEALANGLYTILGNDIQLGDTDMKAAYISMYDNNGTIRAEIPCVSYRAHRLIFDENGMYYSVSGGRIARMDRTGYVNKIYKLGDLRLHHDYIFGSKGDLLVLGSDVEEGTDEDVIFSIDIETGVIKTLIDLKDIFPEYYAMTQLPEKQEYLDWMHINALDLIGDDSVILSSRETSTIIKLNQIYDNIEIDYLIGSKQFWAGTPYEEYVLDPKGNFSLHAGQHSTIYQEDESLAEDEYYIYLYNNNNTVSTTRPDYDWLSDDNYYNQGVGMKDNGANSYFYKYLVNESKKNYSLVEKIPVGYSPYVSSVQELDGNRIVESGQKLTVYEFDQDDQLIQSMKIYGEHWLYRCFKYDYKGYWFAN